jgi:DNA primase large subunit
MIVSGSTSARTASGRRGGAPTKSTLPTRLSFYDDPPSRDLTLGDFEQFAYDRIKVLQKIASESERGLFGDSLADAVRPTIARYLPMLNEDDAWKDKASHFILRLAYCKKEELRRWFCQQELALFKIRFESEGNQGIAAFMHGSGLEYSSLTDEEKAGRVGEDLRKVHLSANGLSDKFTLKYFRVSFENALAMVRSRRVLVRSGYAYVPRDKLVDLVGGQFRTRLSKSMTVANARLAVVLRDARIAPLLRNLSRQNLNADFKKKDDSAGISPKDLDMLSKRSMPLCMSHLHSTLTTAHHLKHHGRMQYGLFLKGAGIGLDDALQYWQSQFTKIMSADDFRKKYTYNIRHNYGKEGKRADYTPYSCMKIIMGAPPGAGQSHGCPFRHWNERTLRQKLSSLSVSSDDAGLIVDAVKSKNYQLACRKHFEVTHRGADSGSVGNHPNAFLEASLMHHAPTPAAGAAGGAGSSASASSTSKSFHAAPAPPPAVADQPATAAAAAGEG